MSRRSTSITAALALFLVLAVVGYVRPTQGADAAVGAAARAAVGAGTSDGCARPAGRIADRPATVAVGAQTRRYTWSASERSGPKPLVLDFHGLFEGTAGVHPGMTQFTPKALTEGFVVAYPIGEANGVLWNTGANGASLRFVDALIAKIQGDACIDPRRIYATGLSYGAFMTSAILCNRSTVFAAAAPVAGLLNPCGAVPRKIPLLTFHGTADPILAYALYSGAPQGWARKYGCGPATRTTVTASDPVTRQPIYKDTWNCAGQGTAVESYVIKGGGHAWPGSAFSASIGAIVGKTATSIDATDIIWDFFRQHSLPA
jgi:polyhydroxybutyrate depolymerase